jgi:hypothetical protein
VFWSFNLLLDIQIGPRGLGPLSTSLIFIFISILESEP